MTALIIDTETTGLDAPEVIALATTEPLLGPDADLAGAALSLQFFRPSKPISLGALATHHIIAQDLEGEPPWPGAWQPPVGVEYLIGHNVDFDWKAIGSPHIARIDTLALSRWVWPDLESHGLGALIYFLLPHPDARELLRRAHSADHDVYLCALVLQHILYARPGMASWHQLWQSSEAARIPTRMPFGKYGPKDGKPGMLISELRRVDRDYVGWCLRQADFDPYLVKALKGAST